MSRFALREHTADVAVEASGATLGAAFAAAGDGLAAAQCDDVPDGGERFEVAVEAGSREALLFDYLDELIYRRDVDGVLPVDNETSVTAPGQEANVDGDGGTHEDAGDDSPDRPAEEWILSGSARGVPLSQVSAREVKAVTYSEMRIERADDGWTVYVVLDV